MAASACAFLARHEPAGNLEGGAEDLGTHELGHGDGVDAHKAGSELGMVFAVRERGGGS